MSERKKLIEVALPLEAINEAPAREKSIRHGHPSTLHLWWARRPLAAARAVIFASLVDDPDHPNAPAPFVEACRKLDKGKNAQVEDTPRRRLFDFIEELVQWESTTNERVIGKARELILLATEGNPPPLLDPFAGGGSIPLEAQRLGLEAHANDLNPVAVMINKAQIEIPPRFANGPPVNPDDRAKMGSSVQWKGAAGLAADVRYYGEWMRQKAWEKIGHLYPTHNGETVIAWLWARTVKCPNPACGADMPLISSLWLSKKSKHSIGLKLTKNGMQLTGEIVKGEMLSPREKQDLEFGTFARNEKGKKVKSTFQCLFCGMSTVKGEYIDEEANNKRVGVMPLVIVTEGKKGRNYDTFNEEDITIALNVAPQYFRQSNSTLPTQSTRGTFASNAQGRYYGFQTFADYFTSRQLVALTTFTDLVAEAREQICSDAKTGGLSDDVVPLRDGGNGLRGHRGRDGRFRRYLKIKGCWEIVKAEWRTCA